MKIKSIINLNKPSISSVKRIVCKINSGEKASLNDTIVIEEPLAIHLIYYKGDTLEKLPLSITMRTPGNDMELVRGFLFTEGIIGASEDVVKMVYNNDQNDPELQNNSIDVYLSKKLAFHKDDLTRHFYTSSSCGVCGKSSIDMVCQQGVYILNKAFCLRGDKVMDLVDKMSNYQPLFSKTGGNHVCYIFDAEGNIHLSKEDVGRHNAMDKLIGHCIEKEKLPLSKYGILLSGRISFELVQKAWLAGISTLIAIGAPSSLAISLADDVGMTLVGFLKKNSFNIYTHPDRIKI